MRWSSNLQQIVSFKLEVKTICELLGKLELKNLMMTNCCWCWKTQHPYNRTFQHWQRDWFDETLKNLYAFEWFQIMKHIGAGEEEKKCQLFSKCLGQFASWSMLLFAIITTCNFKLHYSADQEKQREMLKKNKTEKGNKWPWGIYRFKGTPLDYKCAPNKE